MINEQELYKEYNLSKRKLIALRIRKNSKGT